jgi:hypothetical protein
MIAQALGLLSLVSLGLGAAFASSPGDENENAQQDQEP